MDYYKVLGLEQGASLEEIRKAYREYAAHFHPDKQGGSEFFKKRFQEIQEAYEYLTKESENSGVAVDEIIVKEKTAPQTSSKDTSEYEKNRKITHSLIEKIWSGENWQKVRKADRKASKKIGWIFVMIILIGLPIGGYIISLLPSSFHDSLFYFAGGGESRIEDIIRGLLFFAIYLTILIVPVIVGTFVMLASTQRDVYFEITFRWNDDSCVVYHRGHIYKSGSIDAIGDSRRSPSLGFSEFLSNLTFTDSNSNRAVNLFSSMRDGGTVEFTYFVNEKKIGVDIFDFPN